MDKDIAKLVAKIDSLMFQSFICWIDG